MERYYKVKVDLKRIRGIFLLSFAVVLMHMVLAVNVYADSEYIIADSDSRYLTDADVENLSLQEINYAKNEIFARHGRKFHSVELQNYFRSKSWYVEQYEPNDFDENYLADLLNDCERTNADFLAAKEYALDPNGYQLDAHIGLDDKNSIYDEVLREYADAMAENFTNMGDYKYAIDFFEGLYYDQKLYYALYDFMGDGLPELLISVYYEGTENSEESYVIADAFGTDGTSVQRLASGDTIHLNGYGFCKNNVMACHWSTPGGSNGGYIFFQLEPGTAAGKRIEEVQYEYASGRCYRMNGDEPDSQQVIQSSEYEDIIESYERLEDIPFKWHELG